MPLIIACFGLNIALESSGLAAYHGIYADMSRLYYDKPSELPGAMTWPKLNWGQPATFNIEEDKEGATVKSYLEKVAKLVPSEVIAGYLTLIGFVSAIKSTSLHAPFHFAIFLLCIILTPVYLNSQAEAGKPKRMHLLISTLAFVVWAYATSGKQVISDLYDPAIASIVLVAFSLVSGAVPLQK